MRTGTQALERALALLDHVSREPATARDLAKAAGLARTTALRMLTTLESERFIVCGQDQRYRLGPRVPSLFASWRRQHGVLLLVEPRLRALVAAHDETAYFSVRDGIGSACMAEVESARSVRFSVRPGLRFASLHAGALHKAILAFSSPAILDQALAEPLTAFTEHTITDRDVLLAELARIREQGYSESHGEVDEGVFLVAAPVCDFEGWALGAIGVGVLEQRYSDALVERLRVDVVEAAAEVSAELGYTGPSTEPGSQEGVVAASPERTN